MAAAGQLTQLLQAAQSADAGVRTQAEQQLAALQAQNFSELLVSLSAELADGGKPVDARRLAGLILKNSLDAKEAARKASGRPPACWGPRWPPRAARSRRGVQGRGRAAPPPAAARYLTAAATSSPCCRPSWCSSGWRWTRA